MEEKSIHYEDARKNIVELFSEEFPDFSEINLNRLINCFYQISNYEEEGMKVRPYIYLTNNVGSMVRNIPNCYRLTMYVDNDGIQFKQRIKSLMCFCKNNWQLYICYNSDETIEYGLIKVLNSIKDKSLNNLVFSEKVEILQKKICLVALEVVTGGNIIVRGIKGNKLSISFNLLDTMQGNWEDNVKLFVNACVQRINTKSKRKLNDLQNIYYNLFYSLNKGLHGTICLIVDKDYVDKKGFLADGTWLKEPIELGKLFVQSKNYNEFKLSSYVDLIVTMLNYDGITVIDNAGKILAYNVFIESNGKDDMIIGGARIRAANTLLKHKNTKFIGVYFQSQDGKNFYKDALYGKRRKKFEQISLFKEEQKQETKQNDEHQNDETMHESKEKKSNQNIEV